MTQMVMVTGMEMVMVTGMEMEMVMVMAMVMSMVMVMVMAMVLFREPTTIWRYPRNFSKDKLYGENEDPKSNGQAHVAAKYGHDP